MKITVRYSVWRRVRYALKCSRIPDTISPKIKRRIRNYVMLLSPPDFYPRVHFTVRENPHAKKFIEVDFHVDIDRHTTDIYHPKLEKIKNNFFNS